MTTRDYDSRPPVPASVNIPVRDRKQSRDKVADYNARPIGFRVRAIQRMSVAAPVSGTVYAVLLNHRDAIEALGVAVHAKPYERPAVAPVLYLRPANTWSSHGDVIALPADVPEVDVEATIGIVFDRATSQVSKEDAFACVRGFVVVADLTVPHASVYRPAIRQRDRDGFCVFSANVGAATSDEIAVTTSVDGEARETANTRDLVRDVPTLVADISAFMRFEAGDVLLIGALGKPARARPGQTVQVDAGALGAVAFSMAPIPVLADPIPSPTLPLKGREPRGDASPFEGREFCDDSSPFKGEVGRGSLGGVSSRTRDAFQTPAACRPPAGLRRGRVAFEGAIHDVTEADGRVRLANGRLIDEHEPVWLPPFAPTPRARSIFALGLNYADHAKELAFKAPDEPLVFMKGESSLVGHRGVTPRPRDAAYMHYECELVVVIGRTARGVRRDEAYDFVAGYTVANDYAIRDYLENYYRPNLKVKNREATTPIGPWLVDAALVPDPMQLALSTRVDGRTTQSGTTRDMIFDVPFLVEYLSSFMTLSPGDLILTGTPEGLVDTPIGAVVETSIDGIGTLINTIAAAPRSADHP